MNNRQIVERYLRAEMDRDWTAVAELGHDDMVVTYPQSGETFRGCDNYIAMLSNYPGIYQAQLDVTEPHQPKESVHVVASPFAMPIITVSGAGNTFFFEGVVEYPDGGVSNIAGLIELLDGKVVKETWYFPLPFDPPAWRAPFVEK